MEDAPADSLAREKKATAARAAAAKAAAHINNRWQRDKAFPKEENSSTTRAKRLQQEVEDEELQPRLQRQARPRRRFAEEPSSHGPGAPGRGLRSEAMMTQRPEAGSEAEKPPAADSASGPGPGDAELSRPDGTPAAALGPLTQSKLNVCTAFLSSSGCAYGRGCRLAHSLEELYSARRPFKECQKSAKLKDKSTKLKEKRSNPPSDARVPASEDAAPHPVPRRKASRSRGERRRAHGGRTRRCNDADDGGRELRRVQTEGRDVRRPGRASPLASSPMRHGSRTSGADARSRLKMDVP